MGKGSSQTGLGDGLLSFLVLGLGDSDVQSCDFELISQDWAQGTRRLASAMSCSRFVCLVLGILMYGQNVFELSSRASEICTGWLRLVTI